MKIVIVRIGLVAAIAAGVAVIVLEITQLRGKLTILSNGIATQTTAREKAEADLLNERQEASKTVIALKQTADALETKTAEGSVQAEQIAKLNRDVKKISQERDDAQRELSAYVSSMTPVQLANVAKRLRDLENSLAASEEEKVLLLRRAERLSSLLPNICGNPPIELPTYINAKVLTVDPKWHFVVLDVGEDQQIIPHAELLVNRGGRLV